MRYVLIEFLSMILIFILFDSTKKARKRMNTEKISRCQEKRYI